MRKAKLCRKLQRVELLVFDVDGTFTDGNVLNPRFDVHDGYGITYLHQHDFDVMIVSNRYDQRVVDRASVLNIPYVRVGLYDKSEQVRDLAFQKELFLDRICYIGDDLSDLCCCKECGVFIAVNDAVPAVKKCAQYVTKAKGGYGAVREVIDLIIEAKGWDK